MDKKVIRPYLILNPVLNTSIVSIITYFIIVLLTFLYKKLPWFASLFDLEHHFENFSFNENIWLFSIKILFYFVIFFLLVNVFFSIRDYVRCPESIQTNIINFKEKWKSSLYDVLFFGLLHLSLILGVIFYLVVSIFLNWLLFEVLTFASITATTSGCSFRDIVRFFSILSISLPTLFVCFTLPFSCLSLSFDLNIWKKDLNISA